MNKILSFISKPAYYFLPFLLSAFTDRAIQIWSKKIKIDGVAAVVGDFVILDSDIDKTLIDLQSQEFPLKISTGVIY